MSPRRDRSKLGALFLFISAAVAVLISADARASVSLAVDFDALLADSEIAGVVTPIGRRSLWESGRIYTYTEARFDRVIAGDAALGQHVWIRTMGGVVGHVGQRVDGEAVLLPGESSLLFLQEGPAGSFEVTARGQGQFPIVVDQTGKLTRVVRSHSMGMILPRAVRPPALPAQMAADVLDNRSIDDAALEIAFAWKSAHGL
jgi:hypothetical protein